MREKQLLQFILFVVCIFYTQVTFAQLSDGFDIKKAFQQASDKGIAKSDIDGYVEFLHHDYLSNKGSSSHTHASKNTGVYDAGTIYLNGNNNSSKVVSPNSPQNTYCPNAGFEQMNFDNWTGSYGYVTSGQFGSGFPLYVEQSPNIVNSAGNNAGLVNTLNYHTIMTVPATNRVYPNCVGYDSIACRVIGSQTVSEIPVVNPNGGPTSVRLNGALANYRASKLTYNMALNPNNKNFSISYALVLFSGGHSAEEQPYFSVKITDQNGNLVPGCSIYTVSISNAVTDSTSSFFDPTWQQSITASTDVFYKKWTTYVFDFSNYPAITSVNVEFYVGGCSYGGHWGYAYVDAECGVGGAVTSMCPGSNHAVLTAPAGYTTYQWTGPSGLISSVNGGNTNTPTITPVSAGQVFTCNVTAPNGCSSSFQTTVAVSIVSITRVGSTPSCPNGSSGTANVSVTGSSAGYNYQWVNSAGTIVGNTQTVSGLLPGTYTINVSAPLCGLATATVDVGFSPPSFYSLPAPYCGTVAWITQPGGTNYKWYTAAPLQIISGATSSTLIINYPVNGANYFLVYTTAGGCKDSIKYTLNQYPGGSIYTNNIKSICAGNTNSYAVINLQTTAPPTYNYTVTGSGGFNSVLNNTTLLKDSVTGLSIGTYSAIVSDGNCIYTSTFAVTPFLYTYTLTPPGANICTPGNTTLTVEFGDIIQNMCGLSTGGYCSSQNIIQVGAGTEVNTTNSYPAIYGNYYNNTRHQILYRASELLAAGVMPGKISSIAFNIETIYGITSYPNFTVKMKCTNVADLSTFEFDNTDLSQVFFAPSANITTGWNTYNFPVPYEWDGVSNLLIDVCNDLTSNYTSNSISPRSVTSFASVRLNRSDSDPLCMTTNANISSYSRPNIQFGNCFGSNPAAFNYSWTPTVSLASTNTYTTIANPTVTTVYTVQVNPIGQNNCMQTQSSTVSVVLPIQATVTPVNSLCTNASTVSLPASPSGGIWLGSGVTPTGVLTPSLATPGYNTYTYTFGAGTCSTTANSFISIETFVPSTLTGTINPLCETNPPLNLSTALTTSTLGTGTWIGNGISGTTFYPGTAGVGTHTLTYYTYSSPTASLCPSSSTISVVVSSVAQPTITSPVLFCDNFSAQQISVTPSGGIWSATSGASISTNGSFAPAESIIGNHKIYYTLTNAPCVAKDSINIIVYHFVPATITESLGPFCVYDRFVNLQPIVQFTGGIWSGTGVTGSIFNPSLAGSGNQTLFYTTDFESNGLCPDTKTISIVVYPKPNANAFPNITSGCVPLSVNYNTSTVNNGTALWQFGDSTPNDTGLSVTHIYKTPGTYTANLYYTENGCKDTAVSNSGITVHELPIASFNPTAFETTVSDGQVEFKNQSAFLNNNSYSWAIGGVYRSTQTHESYLFNNSGDFEVTLTATNIYGCADDTTIVIKVKPDLVVYVPNAFTPGNDGLNDVFKVFLPDAGIIYSSYNLSIFDRWGELVFKSSDVSETWTGAKNNSGAILKQDIYVWKISFLDETKKNYDKSGHVSLLYR